MSFIILWFQKFFLEAIKIFKKFIFKKYFFYCRNFPKKEMFK
jgi:hypothetical protein